MKLPALILICIALALSAQVPSYGAYGDVAAVTNVFQNLIQTPQGWRVAQCTNLAFTNLPIGGRIIPDGSGLTNLHAIQLPQVPPKLPVRPVYRAATVTKGASQLVKRAAVVAPAPSVAIGIQVQVMHVVEVSYDGGQTWAVATNVPETATVVTLPATNPAAWFRTQEMWTNGMEVGFYTSSIFKTQ